MDSHLDSLAREAASRPPLRFDVGAEVECNFGGGEWKRGTVVAHHYLEQGWERPAPYQVQLADGVLIFAPEDRDDVVRLASSV